MSTYYNYDPPGNLTGIVNAKGLQTNVAYDTLGRKTSLDDPKMGHWSYAYGAHRDALSYYTIRIRDDH